MVIGMSNRHIVQSHSIGSGILIGSSGWKDYESVSKFSSELFGIHSWWYHLKSCKASS